LAEGSVGGSLRRQLALEAYSHTAEYDTAISAWLSSQLRAEDEALNVSLPPRQTLRYGENPHQQATWYAEPNAGLGAAVQLQGKELSYNNIIDLEAALATVREFGYGVQPAGAHAFQPAAVVVKHTNPCGVAIGADTATALERALDADRVSAFGGIVAINAPVDADTATHLTSLFLECVVAPAFAPQARKQLAAKANLRLLELPADAIALASRRQLRSVLGGVLAQELDDQPVDETIWQVVSKRQPTAQELDDLRFAWRLCRHVRSNAITVARAGQSLGVGAGQMNRVGSARIALESAGEKARGAVLASDGFFPFDDTVRLAASYGIKAVIQPGGSVRDEESITACDELGLAMVVTGRRHFLH
jgi:phosphoribosylaminoimidazolecarboxamide formyltransferase/IMP cyclohydrolase